MTNDLTKGKISTVLLKFSLPMFISMIFQQAYNMADSVIAGKFAGENALAAVGASFPVTMLFMAVAIGTNAGCSVIISNFFGAKNYEKTKTAITTGMIFALFASALLTIIGTFTAPLILKALNTPGEIFADGEVYLQIYIWGFAFLFIYNICTSVFTALGDSKTPLVFLIFSSLGNIVLDYIFVAFFNWGVAGVAWATFIAQGVACVLSAVVLTKRISYLLKNDGEIFSFKMLSTILKISIPCIAQQGFVSIGNLLVQNIINGYGSSVIAGFSAAVKINTFAIVSISTFGNSLSCFAGQNIGAEEYDRVKSGLWTALRLLLCFSIPVFILLFFFGKYFLYLFLNAESVVAINAGVTFLKIVCPFYSLIGFKMLVDGILKASLQSGKFMISTFADLLSRVALAYALSPIIGINGVGVAWIIGWTLSAVISSAFYVDTKKKLFCA